MMCRFTASSVTPESTRSSTSSTRAPMPSVVIDICFDTVSSPRCVPASPVYELVKMIASGSLRMCDITSPTRRPPRAMHTIWLNCQPDSCTCAASRSMVLW